MTIITQGWALFSKQEVTYGTDPTIAVTDAVLCSDVTNTPINGTFVERANYRGGLFGARPQVPVNLHQQITFTCELTGTNEVTTPIPPPIGVQLESCGMIKTETPGTDVQYDLEPDPNNHLSDRSELYNATNKWTFPGSRGTFTANFPENNFPTLAFTKMARYVTPAATAAPGAGDFNLWLPPTAVSELFTTTCTLDGVAFEHITSSFDFGANVVAKDRPNVGENIIITDISGSGTISMVLQGIDAKNWVDEAIANQKLMTLVITQTNPSANWTMTMTCPQIQITGYGNGDSNGEVTEDLTVVIGGDSSSSAMNFTFTSP